MSKEKEMRVVKVGYMNKELIWPEYDAVGGALEEIKMHILAAFENDDMSKDSNILITFGRMKQSELDKLPEFEGY